MPPGTSGALSPDAAASLRQVASTLAPDGAGPVPATGPAQAVQAPSAPAPVDPRRSDTQRRQEPASAKQRRVDVTSWSCSAVEEVEPHGIGMTHWVEVPKQGGPAMVRVRFTGRRVGPTPGEPASFVHDVTVGPMPPGVGRVAVTGRATPVPRGEWEVRAVELDERGEVVRRAPAAVGRGKTTFGPVVRALAPGVRPYAWPSMVLLGTVAAVVAQLLLSGQRGLSSGALLAVTLVACLLGVAGAKVYYLLTHRGSTEGALAAGMSIQGFVLVAISTLILGSLVAGLPIGDVLDVSTPGLLLGMAIGRLGCFFGGCCAGRPTASRWALWSSDREVGVRRIPVQFLESAMTAVLALTTTALVAGGVLHRGGTTFVVGIASYTFGRQLLFPLRDIPRSTRLGRPVTAAVTATAIVVAIVAGLVR